MAGLTPAERALRDQFAVQAFGPAVKMALETFGSSTEAAQNAYALADEAMRVRAEGLADDEDPEQPPTLPPKCAHCRDGAVWPDDEPDPICPKCGTDRIPF
jgi:hypothetical protein